VLIVPMRSYDHSAVLIVPMRSYDHSAVLIVPVRSYDHSAVLIVPVRSYDHSAVLIHRQVHCARGGSQHRNAGSPTAGRAKRAASGGRPDPDPQGGEAPKRRYLLEISVKRLILVFQTISV
jgi:hypothetical protein